MVKKDKKKRIEDWDLYFVTESGLTPGRSTVDVVREAVEAGVKVVQMREKEKSARRRFRLGQKLRRITADSGVDFLVNDRVDLALALDADGVHLGQEDLPCAQARRLLGEESIIGLSASSPEQALEAEAAGADYIGMGSIFTTGSKRLEEDRQAIGLESLRRAAADVDIPLVAIGGIDAGNVSRVIEAGAGAAAVITALTRAEDTAGAAAEMISIIQNSKNHNGRNKDVR